MVYRVVFNYVDAKMNQVKVYFKIYIFFLITKFYDNLMIFEHQVLGSFKSHMDKKRLGGKKFDGFVHV